MTEVSAKIEYFTFELEGITIEAEILVEDVDGNITESVQYTYPGFLVQSEEGVDMVLRNYHIYKETQEIIDDF